MERDDIVRLARQLSDLAQAGLAYTTNSFDEARYREISDIGVRLAAEAGGFVESDVRNELAWPGGGYPTPKVDVRAVVHDERGLLLVREASDGDWCLPGGWADIGLSPGAVAVKEAQEEAGVHVTAHGVIAVLDKLHPERTAWLQHSYVVFVSCSTTHDAPPTSNASNGETIDAQFFGLDELPQLSRYRWHQDHVAPIINHLRQNPGLGTLGPTSSSAITP